MASKFQFITELYSRTLTKLTGDYESWTGFLRSACYNYKCPFDEQVLIYLRYLKQHRKVLYVNLLTSGKLNSHLAEIDKQAEDMFFQLVKQMAEREGVTEQLKVDNQMEWVGRMNNIRNRAKEIVNTELIFA